jgi:hypothetical protein
MIRALTLQTVMMLLSSILLHVTHLHVLSSQRLQSGLAEVLSVVSVDSSNEHLPS